MILTKCPLHLHLQYLQVPKIRNPDIHQYRLLLQNFTLHNYHYCQYKMTLSILLVVIGNIYIDKIIVKSNSFQRQFQHFCTLHDQYYCRYNKILSILFDRVRWLSRANIIFYLVILNACKMFSLERNTSLLHGRGPVSRLHYKVPFNLLLTLLIMNKSINNTCRHRLPQV